MRSIIIIFIFINILNSNIIIITLQEMQELMEMVTTRGRKVSAAVIGVKMEEAT